MTYYSRINEKRLSVVSNTTADLCINISFSSPLRSFKANWKIGLKHWELSGKWDYALHALWEVGLSPGCPLGGGTELWVPSGRWD